MIDLIRCEFLKPLAEMLYRKLEEKCISPSKENDMYVAGLHNFRDWFEDEKTS